MIKTRLNTFEKDLRHFRKFESFLIFPEFFFKSLSHILSPETELIIFCPENWTHISKSEKLNS